MKNDKVKRNKEDVLPNFHERGVNPTYPALR